MTVNVSSATALTSALNNATAGETILLAPGTYGTINLTNVDLNNVTIGSAQPNAPAIFTTLLLNDSSGMTFENLEFKVSAAAQFEVRKGSADIAFRNIDVHGSLDGNSFNDFGGILIRDSANVTISDSEFHELYWGVAHLNMTGVVIDHNDFHDIRMDGVRGGGTSDITIEANTFKDFYPVLAADHADAIQFWTTNTTASAHDITVTGNLVQRGAGSPIQGVYFYDEVGNVPFRKVTITDNLISGGVYHGIHIRNAEDVAITGNIVQGFVGQKSWIKLDHVDGAVVQDNFANLVTTVAVSGGVIGGNTIIPLAADGGAAVLQQWLAANPAAPQGLTFIGTAGADSLAGGAGADRLEGGLGNDAYVVDNLGDKVIEAAGGGNDRVYSSVSFTLGAHVERVYLTGAAAVDGTGNADPNVLTGNNGANRLKGLAGADTMSGAGGADTLQGGLGADLLTGGSGADRFEFARGEAQGDTISDFAKGDLIALTGYSAGSSLTQVAGGATQWMVTDNASGLAETLKLANAYALKAGDFMFV